MMHVLKTNCPCCLIFLPYLLVNDLLMHENCLTYHYASPPNYLFEVKRGKSNQGSIPSLNKAMLLQSLYPFPVTSKSFGGFCTGES